MNGMTGGVEVFWTLLICNYIKFNHIPRDVELVIFLLTFLLFFLGCWYWSWGSQFPIPPNSKGLCSGPIYLPTATSSEGESYPSIIWGSCLHCLVLLAWASCLICLVFSDVGWVLYEIVCGCNDLFDSRNAFRVSVRKAWQRHTS